MRLLLGVVGTLVLATSFLMACVASGPLASPEATPTSSVAPASASSLPSQDPTPAPSGYTLSEAIALRDAGELGSGPITLVGYWSNRMIAHSCAPPPQPLAELELWCHGDEYGITERNEAFAEWVPPNRLFPAQGPRLTPWMTDEVSNRLFSLPMLGLGDVFFPPVPIVVRGHFNDPRAADCREDSRQACRDRFVIDEILSFDPDSVPSPTPTPPPTPFPSPAPAAMFGPENCAGDVAYAFVGWITTDELDISFDRPGHVFAMVTKDVIPIGSWIDDPNGSGQKFRWWGQQVCLTWDSEIGRPFNEVLMEFDSVNGTGFREWEDGRHEPGDP